MVGKYIDGQLKSLRCQNSSNGNTSIPIAAAKGLVLYHDSNWLKDNDGHVELATHWAKAMLQRLGFSKRRMTTNFSIDFEERRAQFVFDVQAIIELEEIPDDLVVNWDQTGIHYAPVSDWMMEKTGAKRVEIVGANGYCCVCRYNERKFLTTTIDISRQDAKLFTSLR